MFEGMFEIFNEEKKDGETEITRPSSSTASHYPALSDVFVISLGGSVLVQNKPDLDSIRAVSQALNELVSMGKKIVVVVGGGKVCREYVNAAKELGANNFEQDELGIRITRANASLLTHTIDSAFPEVLTEIKKAREVLSGGKTPVFGGLMPGFTTDAVAALLAEYLNATFVNLSNVDGIFTADPNAYPTARLYHELSYDRLLEILTQNAMKPGQNLILDLPAAMVLKRSSLTAFFLNGQNLENLKAALQGLSFTGTIVRSGSLERLEGEDEETTITRPRRRASRRSGKARAGKRKPAAKKRAGRSQDDDEELDPDKIRF
jgi:uridylate kinase